MDPSALQAFSDQVDLASTEILNQQVAIFNGVTRGGIVLRNGQNKGDYTTQAKYGLLSGLVRRRNVYGTGTVAALDPARILEGSVKVAASTKPVQIDPALWQWIQRPADVNGITGAEAAGTFIGQQLAVAMMADKLNVGIAAFVAAVLAVGSSDLVYDAGASSTMSLSVLTNAAAKMGDRAGRVVAWVMHSKSYTELQLAAITGSNTLYRIGDVNVVADQVGRPIIVTDSDDLKDGADYYALGLTENAIVIEDNGPVVGQVVGTNGYENIRRTYQGEWDFNVGLKGFIWNQSTGGASPSDAALATGSNWDKVATSIKDLAGVIAIAE